ncbi:hypothetical protein Pla108_03580 [Botrimarina colliarenosi]|uniref:DNA mimic protein DMP19 C-terminal domain-containing protein n=1 Tax=Botrimarina colliarenosi TaxID=2528001 RepID=A0A5C6AK72_9BACT|nr:DUF4375 domain-containing protein [Botrimarina colliarenosi]TWT99421.1 hypothetical protein Pla108_03580 [Botrimarina colliarenosi]
MHDDATQERWSRLCKKWSDEGYSALSPAEKVWLNVRAIIDSTSDGGLISYFYNSGADDYDDMMAALGTLGASNIQSEVKRVAALFPSPMPEDIDVRNDVIGSWSDEDFARDQFLDEVDERLFALFDDLEDKLDAFIKEQGLMN